ncbi:division/cell wall cluster transcriptional repressor MraZ [Candidatus Roizmanbacteria bacterium CG_4_9_14_0_2_um_filter_38_17]|nr:division/cell wall cluster transcriptional repressor MraZ [Candidatus Microgenomates bacterium]PJC32124.1 MAG: division/cell wall cluster transcriptional repressor MraZ [Candidatus Roizmanbacteria bacterium CG_4_9_14_0_2_um_filter_38_17]
MVKSGEMLLGRYTSRVTDKGRVALPAKLRAELGEKIVVTQGYEKSLILVGESSWRELIKGTSQKPFTIGAARDTTRFLLGSASSAILDKQGRFVLPDYLKQHGEITKEVIFLGLGTYIELWDKKRWEEYQEYLNVNIEDISERLSKLNIEK